MVVAMAQGGKNGTLWVNHVELQSCKVGGVLELDGDGVCTAL